MDLTPDDRQLTDAIAALCTALDAIKATESHRLGLTPQQAQLLCMVESGERTHTDLATLLHCDKTNITGLVTRLETRHLVRRQPNREDRRVTQVVLTAEGATLMTHFRDAVTAAVAGPLGVLAGRRRAELVELARAAAERLR